MLKPSRTIVQDKLYFSQSFIYCQKSHQPRFKEATQFVHHGILNQLDLLICCVSDYMSMKQSHPSCLINCAKDQTLLHSYKYLLSKRMIIIYYLHIPNFLF